MIFVSICEMGFIKFFCYNRGMPKQRFYSFMIGTVVEAWIFSWTFMTRSWFFATFFGVLLIRRLMIAYKLDKVIREMMK